jgi:hypothetical protein
MAKPTTERVPVSERALIQRINRVLAKQDEVVKTTRGEKAESELGRHYILNFSFNGIMQKDIDIEACGRELKVLRPWEMMVAEEGVT